MNLSYEHLDDLWVDREFEIIYHETYYKIIYIYIKNLYLALSTISVVIIFTFLPLAPICLHKYKLQMFHKNYSMQMVGNQQAVQNKVELRDDNTMNSAEWCIGKILIRLLPG